jgi:hypothetical protein
MLSLVFLGSLLLPIVLGHPLDDVLDRRAQCNEDNVLRALEHRTPDSQAFCSSYISQPATTTVTITTATYTDVQTTYSVTTRHPAFLYNLQRWSSTQTPLKYATASPKASTVPGGACYYPSGGFCATPGVYKRELEERATATTTTTTTTNAQSVPSYLATVPASRISSACSCLPIPYQSTVTVTTDAHVQSVRSLPHTLPRTIHTLPFPIITLLQLTTFPPNRPKPAPPTTPPRPPRSPPSAPPPRKSTHPPCYPSPTSPPPAPSPRPTSSPAAPPAPTSSTASGGASPSLAPPPTAPATPGHQGRARTRSIRRR